jgi:hypothetical protein
VIADVAGVVPGDSPPVTVIPDAVLPISRGAGVAGKGVAALQVDNVLEVVEVEYGIGLLALIGFRGDGERAGSEPPARGRISACWF